MDDRQAQNFWPPLAAGAGLGLALLGMFLFTGHGLGANGFFTRTAVWLSDMANPVWAEANAYFKPYLAKGHPLDEWISWEIVGVAVRLVLALGGGVLTGFGAPLARGCTSGLGLSGGAVLAVAAFVFLIAFFAAGLLLSALTRRLWQ
ncbi:hypothetical protein SCD_n03078 (plasmid) [Sulfuricella denitrificans skB26]|uniref:Uncharacterized protein n=1 Tax=Sulfuricella denitrificans (strain DSM 22764 / NBRC 105220 / skB26) TaxID=1163617 RepID=S6B979_SULDS|nr:YeeE/YedE thiosulfate transporter family protein [Sulfuricella denitrificans]BAN36877.1 hypothetical protein SCD_n03078 [Sulfuricella denitrificans skB26]